MRVPVFLNKVTLVQVCDATMPLQTTNGGSITFLLINKRSSSTHGQALVLALYVFLPAEVVRHFLPAIGQIRGSFP
jgi:hypothetical protein